MRILSITILFLLVAACKGQKNTTMDTEASTSNEFLELILQDQYSGTNISETTVIKSSKELKAFYSIINRTRKPGLPVPDIDFTKEIVILHCSGKQDDGSLPELIIGNETAEQMIFTTKKIASSKETKAITTPFCLYKMPLTDKEIVFNSVQQ